MTTILYFLPTLTRSTTAPAATSVVSHNPQVHTPLCEKHITPLTLPTPAFGLSSVKRATKEWTSLINTKRNTRLIQSTHPLITNLAPITHLDRKTHIVNLERTIPLTNKNDTAHHPNITIAPLAKRNALIWPTLNFAILAITPTHHRLFSPPSHMNPITCTYHLIVMMMIDLKHLLIEIDADVTHARDRHQPDLRHPTPLSNPISPYQRA